MRFTVIVKRCPDCDQIKPETEFRKNVKRPDGLQGNCISCGLIRSREWYRRNKKRTVDRASRNRKLAVERIRSQVNTFKSKPCTDCGGTFHPEAMDYDHRPGEIKVDGVSALVAQQKPLSFILKEIAKCDLVCANCHRLRTFYRRQRR